MFLSRLALDLRSSAVRRDLRSPWDMHRSLWSAFPDGLAETNERVLWRLDAARDGSASVLVQSRDAPDWQRLLDKYPTYLGDAPQSKPFTPALKPGQRLRFRLRANPSVKRDGKRRSLVTAGEQAGWLLRQGERGGFVPQISELIDEGTRRFKKGEAQAQLCSALFDGELVVIDASVFIQTLATGIGHGKGFGLGLLSVAGA